jgi:exosortase A-associated hydrolase 1
MRRLTSFSCAGETLAGTFDLAEGDIGLLMVTGGSQTRIGSHRMYERLAKYLAGHDISCFRYDRRGVGDSSGNDPGYLASGPDIRAAAAAFREAAPKLRQLFGFGLCDGASALALFGAEAGIDGIVMVNPWLVEAEAGSPPPAAITDHYRRRLTSREGWKKLLSGGVDFRKLLKGISKVLSPSGDAGLSAEIAAALGRSRLHTRVILAEADATAVAASAELGKPRFKGRIASIERLSSDSHTFARAGDEDALGRSTLEAIRAIAAG